MTDTVVAEATTPDSAETGKRPYLSVIVTSRNDDHGGNLTKRMQYFVDGWLYQAKKFNLACELIIVEWNPPDDRPRLAEQLDWPDDTGPCDVRIIEVPKRVHHRYQGADALPLFQFIAKNAAIRRARGKYMLCTNIDILFSDEMMEFLAKQELRPDRIYRNDRYDVPNDIPEGLDIPGILDFCARNVMRINRRSVTIHLENDSIYPADLYRLDAYAASAAEVVKTTGIILARLPIVTASAWQLARAPEWHGPVERLRAASRVFGTLWGRYKKSFSAIITILRGAAKTRKLMKILHTNACGDFTMMSAENWLKIRGHLEYEGYSMHLDSLLLIGAVYGGLGEEEILPSPMRHYHIEHGTGSGFTPENEDRFYEGLRARGLSWMDWGDILQLSRQILQGEKSVEFNDEDWGLSDMPLRETVIGRPATAQVPS